MYESTCSIQCMLLCKISYSVRSCVVYVKYCNHLLAVDMANVVAICRGLACAYACGWKDIGMGVCKGTVVSLIPTLFDCFLGIPSL